jgi:hypothetical protein
MSIVTISAHTLHSSASPVIDFSLGLHIIEFGAQVRRDLGIHKSRLKHQGVILNIMFKTQDYPEYYVRKIKVILHKNEA